MTEPTYMIAKDKVIKYARLGGARSANSLYRVSGDIVTLAQIEERTGISRTILPSIIRRARQNRKTLTWEVFTCS